MHQLISQKTDEVEILIDDRPESTPTGIKRNDLIARAQGEYFCFVDDDDRIDNNYIKLILAAIKGNPDVVTFKGWMTTNGANKTDWIIKLGSAYETRDGKYYRWPNHLSVMKKSIVKHVKFEPIWKQEDYKWSKIIHEQRLLKTEVHIDRQLYFYEERTRK